MSSPVSKLVQEGLDKLFTSSFVRESIVSQSSALARQGEWSATLAKLLPAGRDVAERYAGTAEANAFQVMDNVLRKRPAEYASLVPDFLEGKLPATALDPEMMSSAQFLKNEFDQSYFKAAQAGIDVQKYMAQGYYPRQYRPEIFGPEKDSIIQQMINKGLAPDYASADQILQKIKRSHGTGVTKTLERPRTANFDFYRRDPQGAIEVLMDRYRRIGEAEVYGPNDETIDFLLSNVRKDEGPAAYEFAKMSTDLFLRRSPGSALRPWEKNLMSFEAATKLGLAVIGNTFQPLNNVLVAGFKPTILALRDSMVNYGSAKDFALRSGAIYGHALEELRRDMNEYTATLGSKVLRVTGFSAVERFNRVLSSNIGKEFAFDAFDKLVANPASQEARAAFRLLGIDADKALKRGALSLDDLLQAGKRLSDTTQFRYTGLELPQMWRSHPLGRLLTLYKQFAFNQAKFIKDFVVVPALHGELRPLIYFSTVFPIAGELVGDIKNVARHGDLSRRPEGRFILDRIYDNYLQVGSFGVLADMMYGMASGDDSKMLRFLAGPVLSDAADTQKALAAVWTKQDPWTEVSKQVLRRVPGVGPIISSSMFPSKTKTKDWLQKGTLTRAVLGEPIDFD